MFSGFSFPIWNILLLQGISNLADLLYQGMKVHNYNNELLHLAEDLALRMLPAFDTPTGLILRTLLVIIIIYLTCTVFSSTFQFSYLNP